MSDILIKGMEMPKDVTLLAISPDGTVDIISGQPDLSWKTLKDKAISVPPHGRLVDADEMRDEWLINGENEYVYDTNAFLESIDNQPTVIPAELGGAEGK